MKFVLSLMFLSLSTAALADTAPAVKIDYLQCGGYDTASNVGTTVVYTGVFAGHAYLNLSVGGLTFPSTQQVKVVSAEQNTDGVVFQLHTMLTGEDLTLAVLTNTKEGYLTQDGVTSTLQCQLSIPAPVNAAL